MQPGITKQALVFWLSMGLIVGWLANSQFTGDGASAFELSDFNPIAKEESKEDLDLDLFWDVWEEVEESYIDIDEVTDNQEVYGAIEGLIEALGDPYSAFMDPKETQEFHSSLSGELEGIGAELTVEEGRLIIVSPLKESPAEKAGILPGDHVFMVDGEPTSEMSLWDAILKIRGERGTQVTLTILRETEEEPLEITITRAAIEIPSTELEFKESNGQNIAHLSIYQFAEDTDVEFSAALREVLLQNADGLILDFRRNGGGYLDVSIEMLSEFFEDKAKAVIIKRRNAENEVMYTRGKGTITDIPMVVLIDQGSASASEIVAGALKDHERAVIMGTQSFGKGSVQELNSFQDGSSLRLSIAKWYTPNDISIDEMGITPDIIVEMEDVTAIDTEDDLQLNAAIDYLSNL